MNKSALASAVAFRNGMTRTEAGKVIDTLADMIGHMLEEHGRVSINRFGSFKVRVKRAHEARNPRTGEKVTVAEHRTVVFSPAEDLRRRVNGRK